MSRSHYTRMRQICLATLDIEADSKKLSAVFGVPACHSSRLDEYGLENTMFAIGGSFIELVAPTRDNTAVHRFLAAGGSSGGYMAIFDCEDTARFRESASNMNIRVIVDQNRSGADLLQLNPKDTGVTMLEFDHHKKSDDRFGAYEWAGKDWQQNMNAEIEIQGIEMACKNPTQTCQTWRSLFGLPDDQAAQNMQLDYGTIHFSKLEMGSRDYFKRIILSTEHNPQFLQRAQENGISILKDGFDFCGVNWKLASRTD